MTLSFLLRGGVQEYQATSTQDYVMTARVICKRPALLYALAAAFPLASLAEETVIVTAQPVDSAVSPTQGYSARTSTGATKTDRPLITTAQSVSVITRQQMADRGANTISQALEYTPGFTPASAAAQPALIRCRCAATTAAMLITCFSTACA
jgi:outer membrane receptor for ferric coprogen and ferric-rhodotorulic acid